MASRRRAQASSKRTRTPAHTTPPPEQSAASPPKPAAPPRPKTAQPQQRRAGRAVRTRRWWIIGFCVGVVLFGAGIAWAVWHNTTTAQPSTATTVGAVDTCRRLPRFTSSLGLGSSVGMSTNEQNIKGLVFVTPQSRYQDPSWDDAGTLGPLTLDANGNIYVAPVPRVSVTDIMSGTQNTIYRVDTMTGQLVPFLTIPYTGSISSANSFGILGMAYDCDTNSLYASTVAGSSRATEEGQVVRIDLATKQVIPQISGIDGFAVGVFNTAQGKRLYVGSARRSEVYLVPLDQQGNTQGAPRLAFSFSANDQYGNARARRFNFTTSTTIEVVTIPFAFNLRAGSDRLQQTFIYRYDPAAGNWQYQPSPPEEIQ